VRIPHVAKAAAVAVALAFGASPAVTATPSYSALYVFGDSLVDAGNIAALTGGSTPNQALGYFEGRFTNGYDYTDLLNLALFGTPSKASLTGGNNFAFGGARIVSDTVDAIPDLTPQITTYLATKGGGVADPNALYVLNAGGNDIFALGRFANGQTNQLNPIGNPAGYIQAIVDTYAAAVTRLNALGARNILLTGIPNATEATGRQVEALLQAKLDTLTLAPGTNFYRYSYIDFFTRLQTDPGSLGLPPLRTDTTCIAARAQASGCAGIFSFDGTHPTAAVHEALFRDIATKFNLAAVPEPATWLLMIGGFGFVGAAMRRQRRVAATA
jgi:phospholipase/lecithinase/hemolysin